ncbi:unnamed protein product [Pleuronectes platessa]|uniref:Uncharacterized protein n=1 Tax=Pleuronectes platessa TaxID=8262 RepID=A0A9N7YQI4_PLEPL|nr:unnamed protein product [Pleuronectes platessa]
MVVIRYHSPYSTLFNICKWGGWEQWEVWEQPLLLWQHIEEVASWPSKPISDLSLALGLEEEDRTPLPSDQRNVESPSL